MIGKDRFEKEIRLGRVLKTLRNVRMVALADKARKAELAVENAIDVDSEELLKSNWQKLPKTASLFAAGMRAKGSDDEA